MPELLDQLRAKLHEKYFVFIALTEAEIGAAQGLEPIASFREPEGLSLVIERDRAEARDIPFNGVFRMITLQVHSSLHAVGLTAAVSSLLAEQGIPANIVAAYHHDHVFVPEERAREALALLQDLA